MAIVQVSVHDAVSGVTGGFDTYRRHRHAPPGATAEAAAIGAAFAALSSLPIQCGVDPARLASSRALHHISPTDPGVDYGLSVANDIVSERSSDQASVAQFDYNAPGVGQAGVWVRLGNPPAAALLPGWGQVTPFVIRTGSQFRPGPPSDLTSARYARDYTEILTIGAATGSTRTAQQTETAFFWRASPVTIWNPVVDQVLGARQLALDEEARALALIYLAAADASIAIWDAKYVYNFWRPLPAIRGGDVDGNDGTVASATWTPLLATPPHPEYPSGHTGNSNAMASVMEWLFGWQPGVALRVTVTDATAGQITRSWNTFAEAVDEVIDARVFSGIHFRHSDLVGARLGRQVARYVFTHALRRVEHDRGNHRGHDRDDDCNGDHDSRGHDWNDDDPR